MALSADDTARLAKLRAAYDSLLAGQRVARVQAGSRTVEYAAGDVAELKRAIDQLEAQATTPTTGRTRGALRFIVR